MAPLLPGCPGALSEPAVPVDAASSWSGAIPTGHGPEEDLRPASGFGAQAFEGCQGSRRVDWRDAGANGDMCQRWLKSEFLQAGSRRARGPSPLHHGAPCGPNPWQQSGRGQGRPLQGRRAGRSRGRQPVGAELVPVHGAAGYRHVQPSLAGCSARAVCRAAGQGAFGGAATPLSTVTQSLAGGITYASRATQGMSPKEPGACQVQAATGGLATSGGD